VVETAVREPETVMKFSRMLNVVDCHAERESGKVVVGGVATSRVRPCSTSAH
jgi:proline racemase